ncbi:IclR family transcriptional regulator [Actinomycetospora sp. TBRC 11914]|uniref:IclR family transcriptional regulator n=1 Tax=Actinomycetospora sp. TBRC 11914 TaxID=2729387 RepID=UPI00145F91FE|nr:IclR family transcriptional regulator C-terminal domain-containing protein [Actinomycetospora sp. TBRC 11914]NMO90171.1 helix-turn-helix domain-containing protein [Actinomycetospora sp. TBRC 11914]
MAGLGSVHRALRVLEVVADAGDGITAKAVARRLDYNLSTTYHLLTSLVDDGYLVRLEPARGFGLGPKLPALNDRLRAQLPIPPGLGATLRRAHATAGAAVLYAAYRDADVVVVASDDCPEHPVPTISTWRGALHATAVGKLLLAALPPARRTEVLARDGLAPLASRTISSRDVLDRELAAVLRRGLATDRGEFRERLACMAAPVLRGDPVERSAEETLVGAVAVAVPVVPAGGPGSLHGRRDRLERAVRAAAARVSTTFADGWVGTDPVSTGWDGR